MKTYMDIYLSSEGACLKEVLEILKREGLEPISGPHDFLLDWENEKELLKKMERVHDALKGKKVTYKVETVFEQPKTISWPPGGAPKE